MIFNTTKLAGLYIIELTPFEDHRGSFARTFCRHEFENAGLVSDFVQINHSVTNQKGTIRGLHYQKPPYAEVKLIRCVRGAVLDVAVDVRMDSDTFLQSVSVELSAENQRMIYIPKGFAHGFQTLTNDAELIYQHSTYYHPEAESGIYYGDPLLKIDWPLSISNISEKDKNLTFITNAFTGISLK